MAKKLPNGLNHYWECFDVKCTRDEMLQLLRLLLGKNDETEFEELKVCAKIVGGLAGHITEVYENAGVAGKLAK